MIYAPRATHLASGLPASHNSTLVGWVPGAGGSRAPKWPPSEWTLNGPHLLSGPSCGHLPLSLGWVAGSGGSWLGSGALGSHRLSHTHSLSCLCRLFPTELTGSSQVMRCELLLWVSDLSGQWVVVYGTARTHTPTRWTLDGLIWIAGVTRPLWKGSLSTGSVSRRGELWAPVHACIPSLCRSTRGTGHGAYLLADLHGTAVTLGMVISSHASLSAVDGGHGTSCVGVDRPMEGGPMRRLIGCPSASSSRENGGINTLPIQSASSFRHLVTEANGPSPKGFTATAHT